MATVTVRKADGSTGQTLELNEAVFAVEPNPHCVRQALTQYLANQRRGTHATRTRGRVSGGGKKPYRQKGTGRARQGSTRATQWRGGAIVFGPQPRDYSFRINRKVRRNAFCSIFSELLAGGRLVVIDDFGVTAPKTRQVADLLRRLQLEGKVLIVTNATDEPLALSARNIPGVTPINADNLNVYDLLYHDWVLTTPDVVKRVEATYQ
ncbi:MAG TPA: 50S ribosomal protein L4 [Candidatus Sumerlaeota bacterium]|nr:MAG: 50S ribosomal protein L4 [candidate division BRC1 bacterium ADurb.BinA292]HOE97220.1 50S ribosomal protein L4 [Candidatus Sumerlaeota bacterium]HPK03834.1 50S ribosomal protein L4 [Candidatus Sumerlaeota bacterium]